MIIIDQIVSMLIYNQIDYLFYRIRYIIIKFILWINVDSLLINK